MSVGVARSPPAQRPHVHRVDDLLPHDDRVEVGALLARRSDALEVLCRERAPVAEEFIRAPD